MACTTFDFDELDAAESASSRSEPVVREPSCGADAVAAVEFEDAGDEHVRLREKKPISRARAWFEIRRFFEAEPQRHFGSKDSNEWKIYYAKELLLKSACERLQEDGYVVIDAQLAPEHFRKLVGQLQLDAPEQAGTLKNHAHRSQSSTAMLSDDAAPKPVTTAMLPTPSINNLSMESAQDRALCESCLLSLAMNSQSCSELRPRNKQQFLRFFKTYIHEVAENSMSEHRDHVRNSDKISVQLCFGNMPAPSAALVAPPRQFAVEGSAL